MNVPTAGMRGSFALPTIDATGNPQYGVVSPNSVAINTRGPFVRKIAASQASNDALPQFGLYSPGTLQSRVLQLLHEIGHLVITGTTIADAISRSNGRVRTTPRYAFTFLLQLDGGKSDVSRGNTDKVLNACRNQIKAIGK